MSFEQISYLAQIVASVAVVASLIFVALQIKQNTAALQRNEHNSTMAQWTVIRMAIAKHRDIAELMTAGLHGESPPDAADSASIGADVAGKRLGGFSHLGQNTARDLSEGDFRSDWWSTLGHLAQNARWRELVAQSQTFWLPSWVRLGRRRRARQDLTKRCYGFVNGQLTPVRLSSPTLQLGINGALRSAKIGCFLLAPSANPIVVRNETRRRIPRPALNKLWTLYVI
jgi:hypothetical protein